MMCVFMMVWLVIAYIQQSFMQSDKVGHTRSVSGGLHHRYRCHSGVGSSVKARENNWTERESPSHTFGIS